MTRDDIIGFGKEFARQFQEDDASGMGAELAYRWLFAVFPFGRPVASRVPVTVGDRPPSHPTSSRTNQLFERALVVAVGLIGVTGAILTSRIPRR